MTTSNINKELMREAVNVLLSTGETGAENTVFDINIPENYALELHDVDFWFSAGVNPVTNRLKFYLVDDPDEDADPGYIAEKVIQSTEFLIDVDAQSISTGETKDCHRTLLVQNPNFIFSVDVDPAADMYGYARIWFAFVKISPKQILDLMRQQRY